MQKIIRYLKQLKGFFLSALLTLFRTPSTLFFGLLFPVIFIFIFGYFNNEGINEVKVGLVIPPDGPTEIYRDFKDEITNKELFRVDESYDQNKFAESLEKGEIDGYIVIEEEVVTPEESQGEGEGEGEEVETAPVLTDEELEGLSLTEILELQNNQQDNFLTTITYYKNVNNFEKSEIISETINSINQSLTLKNNTIENLIMETESKEVFSEQSSYIDFVLPGIIGYTILYNTIFGTSFSFLTYRDKLVLKRLFAAPSVTSAFIIGQSTSRFLYTIFQVLILLAISMYVFDYDPIYGTESILQMLVVVILSTFTFLGVGYIIASIARTDDSANALSNLAVFPQFILSGTFFPIENLPHHLAVAAQFTPLYNFNESIRYITIEGLNLWSPEVMTQLGYLGIWTVIFYFLASRVFSVK